MPRSASTGACYKHWEPRLKGKLNSSRSSESPLVWQPGSNTMAHWGWSPGGSENKHFLSSKLLPHALFHHPHLINIPPNKGPLWYENFTEEQILCEGKCPLMRRSVPPEPHDNGTWAGPGLCFHLQLAMPILRTLCKCPPLKHPD